MDLIAYAVPFFLLAIAFEVVWGFWRGNNTYRINDAFSSLMLGILSQARKFVVLGVGGFVYHRITEFNAVPLWSANSWVTWLVAFVLYDFCYYWLHRMGHERQILWAAHVAHHQSEDYNLSTALRQTSTGFLLGWVFYLPMYFLGIPAEVVVTVGALNLIYQFWVHTQHVPELGWFEYVFVSPSNHRVHHAQNDRYLDRNYGGVFIIWDRLFGTYQRELAEEPCIYGIRGPIRSWNPVVALTHIYADMLKDMWQTRRWTDRFKVLWARTGWQPEDVKLKSPRIKSDLAAFQRFDPEVSATVKLHAVVQIVAATVWLALGQWYELPYGAYVLWWIALVWTGVSTAFWLQARESVACALVDLPRLALLCVLGWHWGTPWYWLALSWSAVSLTLVLIEASRPRSDDLIQSQL